MMIYLLLISLLLIEATVIFQSGKNIKKEKLYCLLAFIQMYLIAALRSKNIGNDTYKYLELFDRIGSAYNIDIFTKRYEYGYVILNKIIYFFTHESQWLLIITSFITLLLFIRFIYRTSSNVWLSMHLFITLMFYYFTMSGIRQAFAMAIIVTSYDFLKNRKLLPYLMLVFLASQFHSISMIFIIVYPLSYLKFNKKNVTIALIGTIIVFLTFDQVLSYIMRYLPQYNYYLYSEYIESNNIANIINALIPMVILLFGWLYKYHHDGTIVSHKVSNRMLTNINIDKTKLDKHKKNRAKNMLTNENHLLSFLVLLGMIFSTISIRASVIDRIYYYFAIFNIIYVPNVINEIKNRKEKSLVTFTIICTTLLYNFIIFIFRPEWNRVFPYEFFWKL